MKHYLLSVIVVCCTIIITSVVLAQEVGLENITKVGVYFCQGVNLPVINSSIKTVSDFVADDCTKITDSETGLPNLDQSYRVAEYPYPATEYVVHNTNLEIHLWVMDLLYGSGSLHISAIFVNVTVSMQAHNRSLHAVGDVGIESVNTKLRLGIHLP